jgi:cobalt/nickel transport system permease protein
MNRQKTFLDARIKIILALAFIVSVVSTRNGEYGLLSIHALILVFFLLLSFIQPKRLAKRVIQVLPFALIPAVGIPFAGNAGLNVFLSVLIKSILSVSCITLLTETTAEQRIIQGFARLRMPGIFLLIISFLLRYYRLFGIEGEKMVAAMKSRGGGRGGVRDLKVSGNIIGNLFIRSYQRSERIYSAMASRGFDREKTWNQYYR